MKRNYGIDLLRMVAMVFVILLHLTGVGGICANAPLFSPQFFLSQFLRMATFCAVNCYALISGFVGWNRTPKLSSLLRLWAKVIAFCVVITVFYGLLAPDTVGPSDLWKAFTPVNGAQYWYFTAYVVLFFSAPLLNHAVRSITGREAVFSMVGISVLLLCLPFSKLSQVFLLSNGYSALWLMILYVLGGFMARFEIPARLPAKFWVLGYVLAVLGSFLPRMALLLLKPELWSAENYNLSMQYTNLCVVLAGSCLVGLFSRLKLPEKLVRMVKVLSPHAFGVFLLHTHPIPFRTTIGGRFAWLGTAPIWELLVVLLGATAFIYILGTIVDRLIDKAMSITRLDRLLKLPDRYI